MGKKKKKSEAVTNKKRERKKSVGKKGKENRGVRVYIRYGHGGLCNMYISLTFFTFCAFSLFGGFV